jgi:hypothetical protein
MSSGIGGRYVAKKAMLPRLSPMVDDDDDDGV